jgi:hypothetical protein
VGALALALVVAACTGGTTPPEVATPLAAGPGVDAVAGLQPDDLVDLTVYFRAGGGPRTHLTPVVREVPISEDLPRRALELLLAGPAATDAGDLAAPLPTTTRIRSLAVEGGTARVDLTAAVITDARTVGANAVNEALGLAALANTLTEFPTIDRVLLSVEGATHGRVGSVNVGAFWGAWGLPAVLVRDESVIGPSGENEAILEAARFRTEEQSTGTADAGQVQITSLRIRDRATYVRVVVELAHAADAGMAAKVPPSRVRQRDGLLVLEVTQVAAYGADLQPGQVLQIDDPGIGGMRVEVGPMPGPVRVLVTPTGETAWFLHTLSSPTRVVLDIKKVPQPPALIRPASPPTEPETP